MARSHRNDLAVRELEHDLGVLVGDVGLEIHVLSLLNNNPL